MQRKLPKTVYTLFEQIRSVNADSNLDPDLFPSLNRLTLDDMNKKYRNEKGEEHTLAEWAHLTDREDVLNWVYERACITKGISNNALIHWAITCRQEPAILNALTKDPLSLHNFYHNQGTPLHAAVRSNNRELAQLIIDKIKTDNSIHFQSKALHLAIELNNIDMVELLVTSGISLTLKDEYQNTALNLAVKSKNNEAIKIIATTAGQEKQLTIVDAQRNTPAHNAARVGLIDSTKLLVSLSKGVINMTNLRGDTPLRLAALRPDNASLITDWLHIMSQDSEMQDNDNSISDEEYFRTHLIISPKNMMSAFKSAISQRNVEIAQQLLPFVTNLKTEFLRSHHSALEKAAQLQNSSFVMAICEQRINEYINDRSSIADEYQSTLPFFKGHSKTEKLAAAQALLSALTDYPDWVNIKKYRGALHNGELGSIRKVMESYLPTLLTPPANRSRCL